MSLPLVLYVEDSMTSQGLMRRFLKDLCEIVVVGNVQSAEAVIAEQNFRLIITDFLFPEGDSLEFIKSLRKAEGTRNIPIIVVSSSMDRVVLSRVIRAGANDGLSKPLNPPEFRALVQHMLVEPFFRKVANAVTRVCCFQWCVDDRYYEFCPELNLTVSGATKKEAQDNMDAALRNEAVARADLGAITQEAVVTHIVQV